MAQDPAKVNQNVDIKEKHDKPSQINKYSIYELKSGMDTAIIDYLDKKKQFKENYNYALTKILIGSICLTFTAVAYLYPKPFPQNYYIVLVCVIGYFFFSFIYYLFETFVVKNTFYVGNNVKFLEKECGKNAQRIKNIKLSSEIKPHSSIYNFWIDLITVDGKKIQGEKHLIDCAEYYDERGHILKDRVHDMFSKLIINTVKGIYASLG